MNFIKKVAVRVKRRVGPFLRVKRCEKKRKKLINLNPTMISSNCIGGILMFDFRLPCNSPTVNLHFNTNEDFFRYVSHLRYYSSLPLEEYGLEGINYPVGIIHGEYGDIIIHFMHYTSFAEAKMQWEKRSKRIDYNNVYVFFEAKNDATLDELKAFDALPFEHKVVFTQSKHEGIKSEYVIPIYEKNYYNGKLLLPISFTGTRHIDKFDYISFLNDGTIKDA